MVSGAETPMRSLQLGVGWFPEEAVGGRCEISTVDTLWTEGIKWKQP